MTYHSGNVRILWLQELAPGLPPGNPPFLDGAAPAFTLARADSLHSALQLLGSAPFDIILADLDLHNSSGFESLRSLHHHSPRIPILLLTETADDPAGLRALQFGAQDFLPKSLITPVFLARAIRYAIERKSLEEQLRQAQKMEAVGRLAGGIAHDFNNLLGVILGNTELLMESHDLAEVRRRAEDIQKSARRAANLTRQLLSFSRKQILKPEILDPRTKLVEISEMLSRLVGDDINVAFSLSPQLGNVRMDPAQLEQIILNLVANAREAMLRGGKITIEAQNVEIDETYGYSHASVVPGCYVMIAVSDTGMGMDAETQKHIFEPFFTTKPGGTGLGLATVYGAVKQSGGNIWVYSELGNGTCFKLYFPRVDAPLPAPKDTAPVLPITSAAETILLVEDSDSLREVTREFLSASGYTVIEASNAADALSIAASHSAPIHLLVTDVMMPGMNGRDLATRLTHIHPESRVLYMSGYSGNALVHQGNLEDGLVLLSKPFSRNLLMQKVRELLTPVS